MKVLSLTQPWATLVAIGAKRIETRSFQRSYRGPLAIHAAQGLKSVGGVDGLLDLCRREPFRSALGSLLTDDTRPGWITTAKIPRGVIIAVCDVVECGRITDDGVLFANGRYYPETPEHEFGDYTPGRYAWLLSNTRALPEPIPAKGALGLWEYDGELPR
jgi:hypothetical protein